MSRTVIFSIVFGITVGLAAGICSSWWYGEYSATAAEQRLQTTKAEEELRIHEQMLARTQREESAHEYGLPSNATWEEINEERKKISEQERVREAALLGLSPNASWSEISDEVSRREDLKERGLPESTTRDESDFVYEILKRQQVAEEMALPGDTSWHQIEEKKLRLQKALAERLGLTSAASADEIEAELLRRKPVTD